jgi:UDP-N-acetylmuramate--alanine ligase
LSEPAIDLTQPRRIHVVGVGGGGMSAIASVLVAMGHTVSGSDQSESAVLDRLRAHGVEVHVGHDAAHVGEVEALAISTAVDARNPEVEAAVARGIPVLRRAEILAAIAGTRRTIAVSGTHGKTTTSTMVAMVLSEAGLAPSFIVGGDIRGVGGGARWDDGEWFVVEADESDGTFVELGAELAVVTNVEADHLDFYGDLAAIEAAFDRFLADAPGPNLVCADDPGSARLGAARAATTYGTDDAADYRIVDPVLDGTSASFTLVHEARELGRVEVPLPGLHNVRDAAAAIVTGLLVGASFEAGQAALANYQGVARRFEIRGVARGVTVVDDYAHNPGKVAALLAAARSGDWGRVVAVFQPHRYSRTEDLAREFGEAFVDAVLDAHPRTRVAWLPERADVLSFLSHELCPGDLCLTIGAGDITTLADDLLPRLGPS